MSRARVETNRATRPSSQAHDPIAPSLEIVVEREGNQASGRRLTLDGDVLRIGSNAGNQLVLEDPTVSRVHCQIRTHPGGWRVVDTGSLNGTTLDGVRVRDADLALPECTLMLGDSVLKVRIPSATTTQVDAASGRQGIVDKGRAAPTLGALYGQSPIMLRLFARIAKFAKTDTDVLIEGESGTGKELVAAEIVRRSARADKPFIVLDCASLSGTRALVELFGAQAGAIPGVKDTTRGAFEAARGGTVFLDEVAELPVDVQPLLLRALAEREIRRVGSSAVIKFDARVLSTTNRRIEDAINHGQFREDLYFRLSALRIDIPPLREHTDDLPLLVGAILEELGMLDKLCLFTEQVYRDMSDQTWPGNVRELRNFVERRVLIDDEPAISSPSSPAPPHENGIVEETFRTGKDRVVIDFERRYLKALFEWSNGNVSKAARKAALDRMYLHRLLQRHGIKRDAALD